MATLLGHLEETLIPARLEFVLAGCHVEYTSSKSFVGALHFLRGGDRSRGMLTVQIDVGEPIGAIFQDLAKTLALRAAGHRHTSE